MTAGRRAGPRGAPWLAPVDIASLAVFRIVFGALMCVTALAFVLSGEVQRELIDPPFHFTYWGFGWVEPWPGQGTTLHVLALAGLSAAVAAGAAYRVTMPLLWLGFVHLFLIDVAIYENHYYLIALVGFLMIFVPAHRALSVDARRRPAMRSGVAPAWSLWALRAQIAVAYVFGGLYKIGPDWLRGEPLRMWLRPQRESALLGPIFDHAWVPYFFSWGGLVFDLAVVPLLLWRRTRVAAYCVAVWFHLMNAWLWNIGVFPWFMILATALFFEPGWPRRWLDRWLPAPVATAAAGHRAPPGRAIAALLAAFFALQLLVPLRSFLYPGNVLWTEEGLRFSWRMKLRSKAGRVTYRLRDPDSGREWTVDPREILTDRQRRRFESEPDRMLQLAHELARRKRAEGYPHIEVRADARVSLNGRRFAPIIDPEVDLAPVPYSPRPARWILPLTLPLSERVPAPRPESD